MFKKIIVFCFVIFSFPSFAQSKVAPKQVEEAFHLIFKNPDKAIEVLQQLERDTKSQKDRLHTFVLSHLGVDQAVQSDLADADFYFYKSLEQSVKGSKTYVNTLKNNTIIYKKNGSLKEGTSEPF